MAAAAAASPRTQLCVTVTSPEGYAIGHGCARPGRASRAPQATAQPGTAPAGLPARLNLTVPATALARPRQPHQPQRPVARRSTAAPAAQARRTATARWTLTTPGGRRFTVRLDPVPTYRMRPPIRDPRLPARRQAPPPRPGPRRHLHLPALQPPRPRVRLRTCPAVRQRRENLHLQRRRAQPRLPPRQTVQGLEGHPAEAGLAPVADPGRPRLRPGTLAIPSLTGYVLAMTSG